MILSNNFKKTISLLLAALMILPLAACAGKGGEETGTEPEITTEEIVRYLVKDGEALFRLIRSSYCSDAVTSAATVVYRRIREVTGSAPKYAEDLTPGLNTDNDEFEILVGATNRRESQEKLAELTPKDWFVGPYGNKILAIGGNDDSTVKAIAKLGEIIEDCVAQSDGGDLILGGLENEFLYRHEYPSTEISVAGTKIGEFRILYGNDKYAKEAAEAVAANVTDACGIVLSVSRCPAFADKVGDNAIIVGSSASAERSGEITSGLESAGKLPYAISCEDKRLYLCGYEWGMYAAAQKFIDDFILAGKDVPDGYFASGDNAGSPSVPLTPGCDIRVMSNNCWKCDTNQEAWIALGLDCSAKTRAAGFTIVYAAFKPDIINLQEMSPTMFSYIKAGLKAAGLNYRSVCYYPSEPDDTPILYNADVLEFKTGGHHLYTYGNNGNTKSYTWALFEHKETGLQFIDLTTHLWWKSESVEPGSDGYRLRQAKEVVALADKLIEQYSCPMIISGDFNCNINSTAYAAFKTGGFEDCFNLAAAKDDTRGHHSCSASGFSTVLYEGGYSTAIDHMMIRNRGKWTVSVFRQPVCSFYWQLTDHIPVYSDISFNN